MNINKFNFLYHHMQKVYIYIYYIDSFFKFYFKLKLHLIISFLLILNNLFIAF